MTGTRTIYFEWLRELLNLDDLYTPADLVALLVAHGRISDVMDRHRALLLIRRHGDRFPAAGDGQRNAEGLPPSPAWTGRRWLGDL